jgi:hypothetical protein
MPKMPVNVANDEILLRCACDNLKHIAYLVHDPDNRYKGEDLHLQRESFNWYLTITLNAPGIFDRIRQAARYIFAPHTLRFGNYVELALRNEDVDRLAEFIQTRRKRGC